MYTVTSMMVLLAALFCIWLLLGIGLIFLLLRRRAEKKRIQQQEHTPLTAFEIEQDIVNHRRALVDIIAPSGINPKPLSYMVIDDSGHEVYVRCFTIDSLPKATKFATTFRPLFKFRHVESIIYIQPESEDVTKKKLDRHITVLDVEQSTAVKNQDRNRVRSLQNQLNDTESWVSKIEEGYEKFYKVQFLFILREHSLQELNLASDSFYRMGRKKGIDLCATYACHPESYLAGAPYANPNVGQKAKNGRLSVRISNKAPLKIHYLSRGATADLFNHVSADFRHKNGVPLGRTLQEMKPVFFDPFSPTHMNGYGIIFAGKTGSGKTTMIKAMAKRLRNTSDKYRFAIIDSQRRGSRGEYSVVADDLNGVCHQFRHNSDLIINLCEVSVQTEYDEVLHMEYQALHLAERASVIISDLLTMIQGRKPEADFVLDTYMERVLQDVVDECFREYGILDGVPESLYTTKKDINDEGNIVERKAKKTLPTVSMIVKKIMARQFQEKDGRHKQAIDLILDSLKDYVRLIAYCDTTEGPYFIPDDVLAEMEDYENTKINVNGTLYPIKTIKGKRNYFDGQSTVEFSKDCPCTEFDISPLPENERCVARQIVMSFITEEFSKNNSMNFSAETSEKLIIILEENHENYKFPFMRQCIDNAYRTNRKRNVSTWISQQALSDGSQYEEISQGVIANTAVMFLFKQPLGDKEFLAKHTILNERQIQDVTEIGMPSDLPEDPDEALKEIERHMGECCLIDGGKAVFLKFDVLKESEEMLIASNHQSLQEIFQKHMLEIGRTIA